VYYIVLHIHDLQQNTSQQKLCIALAVVTSYHLVEETEICDRIQATQCTVNAALMLDTGRSGRGPSGSSVLEVRLELELF
jgi:hypothetical protein